METRKFIKCLIFIIILFISAYTKLAAHPIKFAVIGDYGELCDKSKAVAKLVKSWSPDFIITTGDNNYPEGKKETIDANVGSLYSTYIYPYKGEYEQSPVQYNRFFPCLGNHDFETENALPYTNYFDLPGNGRYYDFVKGDVHFFALSSDEREPNGISSDSIQLQWFKKNIQQSQAQWKVVYLHHPLYSSTMKIPLYKGGEVFCDQKNATRTIDFPFVDWGVSAVLTGHLHLYERFNIKGVPYITNGLGGSPIMYEFTDNSPDSLVRFSGEPGAMWVEADKKTITFKFLTTSEKIVDEFTLHK